MNHQEIFDTFLPLIEARKDFNVDSILDNSNKVLIEMFVSLNKEYDNLDKSGKRRRIIGIAKRFNLSYSFPKEYIFSIPSKQEIFDKVIVEVRKNSKACLMKIITGDKWVEGFTDEMFFSMNPLKDNYCSFNSLKKIGDFLEVIWWDIIYKAKYSNSSSELDFKIVADRFKLIYTDPNGEVKDVKSMEWFGPNYHLV